MGIKKMGTLLTPKVVNAEYFELTGTTCVTLQGAEEQVELFTNGSIEDMFKRLADEAMSILILTEQK